MNGLWQGREIALLQGFEVSESPERHGLRDDSVSFFHFFKNDDDDDDDDDDDIMVKVLE